MRRRSLFVALVVLALAPAAYAQDQGQGADPADQQDQAPSAAQAAAAHQISPEGNSDVAEASPVARRLFKDLVCMCGGCQRETLEGCKCGFARQERAKVLKMLAGMDLSTPEAQEKAYQAVITAFIAEHGEQVLTVPLPKGFNRLAGIGPYVIFGLATLLVVVLGVRWVRRGRVVAPAKTDPMAGLSKTEREDLEDRLDDELRELD
jgi:cytochrome c-type biogenesis protein CcmH/NrfF